jgi:hypothetical protein
VSSAIGSKANARATRRRVGYGSPGELALDGRHSAAESSEFPGLFGSFVSGNLLEWPIGVQYRLNSTVGA